jgi:hypothetical protein
MTQKSENFPGFQSFISLITESIRKKTKFTGERRNGVRRAAWGMKAKGNHRTISPN